MKGCPALWRNKSNNHWKLPPLHWLHWIISIHLTLWDDTSWLHVLEGPALTNFVRVALGLLQARQSHLASEGDYMTIIIWQWYRLCFPLYIRCWLWYLGSICRTHNQANCLADCYKALHICLILTFYITDLAVNWLLPLLQNVVRNVWKTPCQWPNYIPFQMFFGSTTLHKQAANIPVFLCKETLVTDVYL